MSLHLIEDKALYLPVKESLVEVGIGVELSRQFVQHLHAFDEIHRVAYARHVVILLQQFIVGEAYTTEQDRTAAEGRPVGGE